jgi:tetratricopeptide (TPR) repeat protein
MSCGEPAEEGVQARRQAIKALIGGQAFAQALAAIEEELLLAPADFWLCCRKGEVLRALRRFDESSDWFEAMVGETPGAVDLVYQLSASTLAAGRFERTVSLSRSILDQQPDHLGAWLVLVDALARSGDPERALTAVDAALAQPLDNLHLKLRRGSVLRQLQRFEESAGWLADMRGSAAASPGLLPVILTELASAQASAGHLASAIETLKTAVKANPGNTALLLSLVQLEIQTFEWEAALARLEEELADWPDHAVLRRLLVNLLMSMGRMHDADEKLRQFGAGHEDQRRWVDLAFRRFAEVRQEIDELGQGNPAAGLQTFYLLQAEGQLGKSSEIAWNLFATDPSNPVHAASVLNDAVRRDDAIAVRQILEKLAASVRQAPAVRLAEAALLRLEGQIEEAAAILSEDFRRYPGGLAQIITLANLALQEGMGTRGAALLLDCANGLMAQAERHLPELTCRILRLRFACALGDWPQALDLLETVCAAAPRDMSLLQMKARCLYELEQFEEAGSLLDHVLEQAPADRTAVELRKALLLARGDIAGCLDFLEAKVEAGHAPLDTWLMSALCDTGQAGRAQVLALRHLPGQPASSDWKLERFRKLFLGEAEPASVSGTRARWSRPIPDHDLRGLLYEADWDGPSGPVLQHAQYFAREALCPPGMDGVTWRRRACRPGHEDQVMSARVLLETVPPAFGRSAAFAMLRERVESRQPTMIVSTHAGARLSVALTVLMKNLAYVTGPRAKTQNQVQGSGEVDVRILHGFDSGRLAADAVRSLRGGSAGAHHHRQ